MRMLWSSLIAVVIPLAAGIASAQAPPGPAPGGAFESLSPGNQKIALAIYDSGSRARPTAASESLSLDEIARMKESGRGWGEIFHDMRSRGLVQDKNLGQAVSGMHRSGRPTAAPTEITTASGRTLTVSGHGRRDAAWSGRRRFGSDDPTDDAARATAAGRGREGGARAADGRATAAHGGATAAHGATAGRGGSTAAYGGATAARGEATAASVATAARGSAAGHGGGHAR